MLWPQENPKHEWEGYFQQSDKHNPTELVSSWTALTEF